MNSLISTGIFQSGDDLCSFRGLIHVLFFQEQPLHRLRVSKGMAVGVAAVVRVTGNLHLHQRVQGALFPGRQFCIA